ncbi:carbohydrate kinase [Panacibacter ginsenosidivorans]|uniref:Carbohydrate kinase n=1 Tax=Panacibacter ginsenosidivorans TaxID=1813871 RepID=A0A5B8VFK6_9BACT|nr:carbohydrate kinase [Panacibacter ginsenosidivorans]
MSVIAIFDIGKTNKKILLFDEQYHVVQEESVQLDETTDEDGFPCEDLKALTNWIWEKYWQLIANKQYDVKAVNFSGYGASFVHLNDFYKPLTPLYNYLKPYPENLKKKFYDTYGGESLIAKQTASPVLGNLNSGMQLYRLKYEQPKIYEQIKYSLHLPQYLSFIVSARAATDITSVGCHTQLWNFKIHKYHKWVYDEGMRTKFAPIYRGDNIVHANNDTRKIAIGIGLHDSSAALIPYLSAFTEPFILLSTGTWCISLNPFNHSLLTDLELHQDCLCYLSYKGTPVKASRLFAGNEHEQQTKRLAAHFNKAGNYFTSVALDEKILNKLHTAGKATAGDNGMMKQSMFATRDISAFENYEAAYHQLIADIIVQQVRSTKLVLNESVKRIFVDGGFSRNAIYMHLLAEAFPGIEVYAATVAQASALGAALAIHHQWNAKSLPDNIIDLKLYSVAHSEKA